MLHHFYACFRYRTCKFLRKPNNERFILFRSLMIIFIKILQVKDLQFWSLEIPNNVTYDLYKDTPKGSIMEKMKNSLCSNLYSGFF